MYTRPVCFFLGVPIGNSWYIMISLLILKRKQGHNSLNHFPSKPWFLRVCSLSLLKTLWEKEKLLVTSNFSFSHNVFYPFEKLAAIFIKVEFVVCKVFQFEESKIYGLGKG